MLCCLFEIGLLVLEIVCLAVGKIPLGSKVVKGAPARIIGVILLLPLPICFAIEFVIGVQKGLKAAKEGRQFSIQDLEDVQMIILAVHAVAVLLALGACLAIALTNATIPEPDQRERYYGDQDRFGPPGGGYPGGGPYGPYGGGPPQQGGPYGGPGDQFRQG
jgi:hypothetical protein